MFRTLFNPEKKSKNWLIIQSEVLLYLFLDYHSPSLLRLQKMRKNTQSGQKCASKKIIRKSKEKSLKGFNNNLLKFCLHWVFSIFFLKLLSSWVWKVQIPQKLTSFPCFSVKPRVKPNTLLLQYFEVDSFIRRKHHFIVQHCNIKLNILYHFFQFRLFDFSEFSFIVISWWFFNFCVTLLTDHLLFFYAN